MVGGVMGPQEIRAQCLAIENLAARNHVREFGLRDLDNLKFLTWLKSLRNRTQRCCEKYMHEFVGKSWRCVERAERFDLSRGVTRLFFEFTQPADATCFMSFDMSAWGGPLQRLVFNEQGVVGIWRENPRGCAYVTSCNRCVFA